MNNIYRAQTNCPICHDLEEIWVYNSVPMANTLSCSNCNTSFESTDYFSAFLDLRSNLTISSVEIAMSFN